MKTQNEEESKRPLIFSTFCSAKSSNSNVNYYNYLLKGETFMHKTRAIISGNIQLVSIFCLSHLKIEKDMYYIMQNSNTLSASG